jgi:hypothetical protein
MLELSGCSFLRMNISKWLGKNIFPDVKPENKERR